MAYNCCFVKAESEKLVNPDRQPRKIKIGIKIGILRRFCFRYLAIWAILYGPKSRDGIRISYRLYGAIQRFLGLHESPTPARQRLRGLKKRMVLCSCPDDEPLSRFNQSKRYSSLKSKVYLRSVTCRNRVAKSKCCRTN